MHEHIDWTKLTDDPVNEEVRNKVIQRLLSIRKPLAKGYERFLAEKVTGKTALDIGVCEHTMERMLSPKWKHNAIKDNARYSMGVDIIPGLVQELKKRGIEAEVCDATSETFLGKKFEVVHAGDIIEHVDSPVGLLKFCARHLEDEGRLIVRTPNGFCHDYVHQQKVIGTDKSNLEHVSYICPTHALELGRRAGLLLTDYYVQYPSGFTAKGILNALRFLSRGKLRHALAELFSKPESYSTIYVYEFTLNRGL
ncbi:methyltransferase domain-containing protein [Patescibacteria group bacterium]|nr:methyltransferase domain-containing protein [Patescibacteria group bacterium]